MTGPYLRPLAQADHLAGDRLVRRTLRRLIAEARRDGADDAGLRAHYLSELRRAARGSADDEWLETSVASTRRTIEELLPA